MTISMIAALSENRVIGNKGQIPWHIKEDLIRFRNLTLNHVVIMGRKAFEGMWQYYKKLNKPLPNRTHIVITHQLDYKLDLPNVLFANSFEDAIEKAKLLCHSRKSGNLKCNEIFIAGGGQIYEQAIKYADKLYLTIVKGNFKGDAFFPDYSDFNKVISKEDKKSEGYEYIFLELKR